MAKLVVDSNSLVSVADAIRTKGGTSESLTFPQGFVDAVGAIESGGGGTEEIEQIIDQSGVLDSTDGTATEKVERLIDKADDGNLWYEASKKITSFASNNQCPCFVGWAYSRLPRTDFSNIWSMSYAICGTQLEYIDYYINSVKCTNFSDAMSANKKLKWIVGVDLSSTTTIFDLFMGCSALETIQEPLNIANVNNARNAFQECGNLKYIRFVAECIKVSIAFPHASLLTAESVQSIVDGLDPKATGQTLTFPPVFNNEDAEATVNANIEEIDGVKRIKGKEGWTLVR